MVVTLLLALSILQRGCSQTLASVMAQKEEQVREMALRAELLHEQRCAVSDCLLHYQACASDRRSESLCDGTVGVSGCSHCGMLYDFGESSVRNVAVELIGEESKDFKEATCYSSEMDRLWTTNEEEDPSMEYQGYAHYSGMFRIFPGRAQGDCYSYDPRVRPWFIAATSGPKDVVLVLDVSGSMATSGRMALMKEAAKAIISSLTVTDFFSVVTFSSTANLLRSGNLVQATKENQETYNALIDDIHAGGATNYEDAFRQTYAFLEASSAGTGCATALLFLTDGDVTAGAEATELVSIIQTLHEGWPTSRGQPPVLFAYTLGEDITAAARSLVRDLSCQLSGVFQHIDDNADLRGQMSLYYDYFAFGIASRAVRSAPRRVSWVEPFLFATAGVRGTSVSAPVYDWSGSLPLLVGVVSTGFSVTQMEQLEPSALELLTEFTVRSDECSSLQLTTCQLEALRARAGADSTCGVCTGAYDPLLPDPCGAVTYPTNLWKDRRLEAEPLAEKRCCSSGPMCTAEAEEAAVAEEEPVDAVPVVSVLVVLGIVIFCLIGSIFYVLRQRVVAERQWEEAPPRVPAASASAGPSTPQAPPSYEEARGNKSNFRVHHSSEENWTDSSA